MATIDSKIPEGALAEKWTNYKAHQKLVNPANKRRLDIIVVGTGLAGASAAASLGALGFKVLNFCIQDSPRRAHSIAAQGGINAAKNYQNDGDSVYRLFYDTIKGGDYRAREANVYRLAEVSNAIIDQCVAQGVPFAREYGGLLDNRSFGGAQVSRTFYARGQTGQQLLLGAYSALSREVQRGNVKLYTRYEMLDVVLVKDSEGVERARGILARNLVTGKIERFAAHAVVIGTGGYGNTYFLSTNAMGCNGSAAMQCYRKGAYFANPCFAQIHPTCVPVHGDKQSKLTLMSESLRNDGRIWVPKKLEDAKALQAGKKKPTDIPDEDRDFYLERRYPAFGNLVPRDVASRAAKERCDAGYGVNNTGLAVFLDFKYAIDRLGEDVVRARYGNLFDMYEEITDENPYKTPMMIFPAIHYTMGGIWVPKKLEDAKALQAGKKKPTDIPDEDRDFYLERRYPAFGNLVPRDVASRAAKERCDAGYGVNNTGLAVFLDFKYAIERLGEDVVRARYGNLFDMYEEITDENPYKTPMMIFPAIHYTMGGIWVDYELMTSIKGLFAIGEANFSDHGANRLGASALMQGLADGYFVLPYTIQNYLSDQIQVPRFSTDLPEFEEAEKALKARIEKLMNIKGKRSVDSIHKELGHVMWDFVGMGRTKESLTTAIAKLKEVRKTFYSDLRIPGNAEDLNVELEKALRLEDFIGIGELMAYDALNREESCGGHFREEHQTPEGEALRHDDKFSYVACWKYTGEGNEPELIKEDLNYEFTKVQTRNYKS